MILRRRRPATAASQVSVGRTSRAWVAAAAVVLAVAGGVGVAWLKPGPSTEDHLAVGVRDELDARAVEVVEGGTDPYLMPTSGRLVCAARTMGIDPVGASRASQARTSYVWALCSTVHGEAHTGFSIPLVVHLAEPVRIERPGDGSLYGPDIRHLFPQRLQDLVFDHDYARELEPELQQRMRQVS